MVDDTDKGVSGGLEAKKNKRFSILSGDLQRNILLIADYPENENPWQFKVILVRSLMSYGENYVV